MKKQVKLIEFNSHDDLRGSMIFANHLDLSAYKRMYCIKPAHTDTIRAWQGLKKKGKCFIPLRGKFLLNILEMDLQRNPINSEGYTSFLLDAQNPKACLIPGGYYNGFRALEADSELLVLSDLYLEESMKDDYRKSLEEVPWTEEKK